MITPFLCRQQDTAIKLKLIAMARLVYIGAATYIRRIRMLRLSVISVQWHFIPMNGLHVFTVSL
jgi:hypothetical protein